MTQVIDAPAKATGFGGVLRSFRRRRRWTQEELGRRAGCTGRWINRLERDATTRLSVEGIAALADGLELTGDERIQLIEAAGFRLKGCEGL